MSDLSITAANVISGSDDITHGTAGAAVTAMQTVYKDPITSKWLLSDNNSATVAARVPGGVALHAASPGQPLAIQKSGPITAGATLTPGVAYYQSGTPGGICPVADLTTGMYPTILGIATSATVLGIDIQPSGVAL
jgi:hypothetical protein